MSYSLVTYIVLLGICQIPLFAHADEWLGTHPLGPELFPACTVAEVEPINVSAPIQGRTAEALSSMVNSTRTSLEQNVRKEGYNAILGYRLAWVGGSVSTAYAGSRGGVSSSVLGALLINGTAVKLTCK